MTSSIILTVHNKGELLHTEILPSLKKNTDWSTTELIIVLDGCTDNSKEIVMDFCHRYNHEIKISVVATPNLYETRANNHGAILVDNNSRFLIFVQDDCSITEKNWNLRLLEPFHHFKDVFAVSGNMAHNWELNPNSVGRNAEGWCDLLNHTQHANKNNTERGIFAIRDSCNRGPLAINKKDFFDLGMFDLAIDKQDMDDHLLMYDAKKKLNKVCGFYGVDFISKPEWGGTRENGKTKQWSLDCQAENTKLFLERHKDIIGIHNNENRIIR